MLRIIVQFAKVNVRKKKFDTKLYIQLILQSACNLILKRGQESI